MIARTYTTKADEVLDWIVSSHYGRRGAGMVEAVLEANPGLADHGATLPAGVVVTLPVLAAPVTITGGAKLWD